MYHFISCSCTFNKFPALVCYIFESPAYHGVQFTSLFAGKAMVITLLLASLNSCTNPWIYMAFSDHLRRRLVRCCRCKLQVRSARSSSAMSCTSSDPLPASALLRLRQSSVLWQCDFCRVSTWLNATTDPMEDCIGPHRSKPHIPISYIVLLYVVVFLETVYNLSHSATVQYYIAIYCLRTVKTSNKRPRCLLEYGSRNPGV